MNPAVARDGHHRRRSLAGRCLHYWPTALTFLVIGVLVTVALTIHRYQEAGRHAWQPLAYLPVLAGLYLAAEYFVLDALLAGV